MHCLEIPVDHRLPNLASLLYHNEPAHGPRSEHVDILSKFGQSLSIERDDGKIRSRLPADELDFGLELARPECTGGLVVALHHPDPSQIYADGYAQEEARCRTLAAIKDLVRHITSGILDISSISVLDSMPFISADYDGSPVHFQSQKTFLHALEAKRPEVVISCFRTKTNIDFLEKLQSQGIGRGPPFQRMRFPKSGHEFTKVNAFHPSYAVNRMRFDGCFRRLLVLEFSQAFARAHGTWTEEPWMDKLRKECTRNAALYNSTDMNTMPAVKDVNLRITTADFIASLKKVDYFRFTSCATASDVVSILSASQISWRACDMSLLLQEDCIQASVDVRLLGTVLKQMFKCLGKRRPTMVKSNTASGEPGWAKHRYLLDAASDLEEPCSRAFHDISLTLLRQLNITFTPCIFEGEYTMDLKAQARAFLRFAEAVEDMLRRSV